MAVIGGTAKLGLFNYDKLILIGHQDAATGDGEDEGRAGGNLIDLGLNRCKMNSPFVLICSRRVGLKLDIGVGCCRELNKWNCIVWIIIVLCCSYSKIQTMIFCLFHKFLALWPLKCDLL